MVFAANMQRIFHFTIIVNLFFKFTGVNKRNWLQITSQEQAHCDINIWTWAIQYWARKNNRTASKQVFWSINHQGDRLRRHYLCERSYICICDSALLTGLQNHVSELAKFNRVNSDHLRMDSFIIKLSLRTIEWWKSFKKQWSSISPCENPQKLLRPQTMSEGQSKSSWIPYSKYSDIWCCPCRSCDLFSRISPHFSTLHAFFCYFFRQYQSYKTFLQDDQYIRSATCRAWSFSWF